MILDGKEVEPAEMLRGVPLTREDLMTFLFLKELGWSQMDLAKSENMRLKPLLDTFAREVPPLFCKNGNGMLIWDSSGFTLFFKGKKKILFSAPNIF